VALPVRSPAELRALAQRVADALPADVAEEVVLTGGVSRGVADELSDIEMLVVTREPLELSRCFALAAGAGLEELDTWGPPGDPERRVSGLREGVPLELVWWPRDHAEARIDALLAGRTTAAGDALAHGVALRTSGLLAVWQERLRTYPPELAAAHIEQAALRWGGFRAAGLLTLARPGDRLALTEWLVDSAARVLAIVFALNGLWPPTSKRLAARVAPLAVKPDHLAERIEQALAESDPRRALLVMAELQLEAVRLAPSGPSIDRAGAWLAEAVEVLRGRV
jgi:predicted nucleotidyltransferase